MTLKSNAKFKEKLTWGFKYDMSNLVNFHHSEVQKFNFNGLFLSKGYEAWANKKYRGVIFHDTKEWCEIWINPAHKWHEELGELWLGHPKVWKLYIDGPFLSKAYTVSVRKFQRNYVSWHWRVLQSLNENWLVAWKMT